MKTARAVRFSRPRRAEVCRAVAAVVAVAFALAVVEAAPHHDSTCERGPSHHACPICVVAHAPGLPASLPTVVAVVRRPVGRPAPPPVRRALTDTARSTVNPRSPPHLS